MKDKKKLVICGGAGFVGNNLTDFISDYDLFVIDKHKENLELLKRLHPDVNVKLADLSVKGDWCDLFKGADCIVQLNARIASFDREDFVKDNVIATENILQAMKDNKVHYIIHVSSAAVNSVRLDAYAETKKKGQKLIEDSGLSFSILIPSMMFGPFDNKNIGWLMKFMKKSPVFPIPGSGEYPRQPVYVKDFCRIISYLIENKPKNKIFEINGDAVDFIEIVKIIRKETGMHRLFVKLPLGLFIFLMKCYNSILGVQFTPDQVKSLTSGDTFKMYPWWDEFKIEKTSFEAGVRDMLKSPYKKIMLKK